MKQIKLFAAAAIVSLSLFSCSGNSPEASAEKFLTLTQQGEFAQAKEYCTEQTGALLSMAEGMVGDKKAEMKEKSKDLKVNIVSSEIKGDSVAVVKYKVTGGEASADAGEKSLDLKKVDGKWKVHMNKEGGR
ncbi:MAG: lumazine-binding protein [Flavobacterium psychrophilum]|nr:MAG: lumazine-binding protein [Flavobacterium psychrophilum]